MSNFSSYLDNLSAQAKSIKDNVSAFRKSTPEEKQEAVQAVKQKAKSQRKEFLEQIKASKKQTRSFWEQLQKRHRKSVKKGKKTFSKHKKKLEAKDAERYASVMEEDAIASIMFAMNSIVEAEQLVIEALNARTASDVLKDKAES